MDTIPLRTDDGLDRYRKLAADLVAACQAPEAGGVRAWASDWQRTIVENLEPRTSFVASSVERAIGGIIDRVQGQSATNNSNACTLDEAQKLVARAHSFDTWEAFGRHLEAIAEPQSIVHAFERAADAVVTGDLATLEALVAASPALSRARSTRSHHATLLHYVSANGVEDFRQRTPSNAVAIARVLLDAGAAADAAADTYGGGPAQTPMNLLVSSEHPAAAGVQSALVEMLVDYGAAVDGVTGDGSPLMTALAFGYLDAAETLARRGARVDHIVAAAALGRDDLVRRFLDENGALNEGVRLADVPWPPLPRDPKAHVELALVWACRFGRAGVVSTMLGRHVDPAAADVDRMTGFHVAAANGHMEVIDLLVGHSAPLEARNRWGGTVLDSTVFFALNGPVPGVSYPAVVERLLAAGADARAVDLPTGNPAIDALFRRYRS